MDRKEAIRLIKDHMRVHKIGVYPHIKLAEALSMAIAALQEPERKKGHWIILSSSEDSAVCKCSVCGEDFVFYEGEFFPNYCGDCGSDMMVGSLKGNDIEYAIIDEVPSMRGEEG